VRIGWTAFGLGAMGVGGVGIIVHGLPTTVFFIVAAWAFARSNPRLEPWVLGLPGVGPLVQDYRDGLGMPRRAKVTAVAMIVAFVGLSSWLADSLLLRSAILLAGVCGLFVVVFRVPVREEQLPTGDDRL
jgi:uncharacterized membrane protein YbaN (DUF454 family)